MIEFDTLDEAKRAKDTLNGADIYSGCCTLKIEYAKVSDKVGQHPGFDSHKRAKETSNEAERWKQSIYQGYFDNLKY